MSVLLAGADGRGGMDRRADSATSLSPEAPTAGRSRAPLASGGDGSRRIGLGEVAVLGFFLLFYANVFAVASQRYGVPTMVSSGTALLLAVPLVRRALMGSGVLVVTPTLVPILAYLMALCASAAAATHADATLPLLANFLLEGLVLYLLVSNAAVDAQVWARITAVIVVAATAMAALAVFQELTSSYESNFGGFAQVSAGGFDVAQDGAWVKQLRPRLAGPIGEQNRFAQILLAAAPFAYFSARAAITRGRRIAGYVAGAAILSGVLVTFSRAASVALACLVVLMLVHRFVNLRQVLMMAALFGASVWFVAPDYVVRLTSLASIVHVGDPGTKAVDGAIRGRTVELQAAWNTFVAHPVVGVGPGQFFREYSRIEANKLSGAKYLDSDRRAHNLYAELLADLGVVGFAAFAAANITTISLLVRARRAWRGVDISREYLAAAALFSLYSYLLTAVFLHLAYQRYFWALLALCNGVAFSLRTAPADAAPSGKSVIASRRPRPWR